MPPSIVALPPRSGSMQFTDEDVAAVIDLLKQCEPGQAVRLTDDADASDNTARRRAEILKEQMSKVHADPIKEGYKVRGHVLTAGEGVVTEHTSKKNPDKTYKVTAYPENWAAVSLVPDNAEDEPAAEPEPGQAQTGGEPPAETPAASRRRRNS